MSLRELLENLATEGYDLSRFGEWFMQDPITKKTREKLEANWPHDHMDIQTWMQNFANYVELHTNDTKRRCD